MTGSVGSDKSSLKDCVVNQSAVKEWRGMVIRLGISIALVVWLTWHLDLSALSQRLTTMHGGWVALSFFTVFAAVVISAWKWGLILKARGHPLGYLRLLRHYFVGLFFNNVLPTTVGGDAVRGWETSKDTDEIPEAVGSVVTERLIAGVALGVTAVLGLPFVTFSPQLLRLVALFLLIDVGLVALFLIPKVAEGIVAKLIPPSMAGLHLGITQTVQVVRATLKNHRLFIKVALYSIAFQILVAAVNACIFKAMAVPVSLAQCIIFTPMIFTVTMLPISLSGFGVREAAYWYFFAQVGVSQADAVAASLAFFVIVGIASLPGALLFSVKRPSRSLASA